MESHRKVRLHEDMERGMAPPLKYLVEGEDYLRGPSVGGVDFYIPLGYHALKMMVSDALGPQTHDPHFPGVFQFGVNYSFWLRYVGFDMNRNAKVVYEPRSGIMDGYGFGCYGVPPELRDGYRRLLSEHNVKQLGSLEYQYADVIAESDQEYKEYCLSQPIEESALILDHTLIGFDNFYRPDERLVDYTTPKGVTALRHPFNGLKNLKRIVISPDIEAFSVGDIDDCPALEEIVFPDNMTRIYSYSINNCPKLKRITFPRKMESTLSTQISDCEALEEIEATATEVIIDDLMVRTPKLKRIVCADSTKKLWIMPLGNMSDPNQPHVIVEVSDDCDVWSYGDGPLKSHITVEKRPAK